MKPWQERYSDKLRAAEQALERLRNGQTIYVGSGAGEPRLLTEALARHATDFLDIEIIHLASLDGEPRFARPELAAHFRYNKIHIGRGAEHERSGCIVDSTPIKVSELPRAMASGLIPIDVALIQVTPPDRFGLCSLGVSVDATKAAAENATVVIAQVNEELPSTLGDTQIPVSAIDVLVEGKAALTAVAPLELDPVSLTIGRHVAGLIHDGMTLHFDRSRVSAATMRYLDVKSDLGVHTDILTDDILRLVRSGAVTNRHKTLHRGKTVATMVMGSHDLYRAVKENPYIEILPVDQVNDPGVIAQNDGMVAVLSVQEMELTGQSRTDTPQDEQRHDLPSSMDFIDGARRSKNGFTILALPSTTFDGASSRIVAHSTSRGTAFNRASVDFVVTEYGVVNLYGLSIRERAIALISIAHPKFRARLLEDARRYQYVGADQPMPPETAYPHQYEFRHTFRGDTEVFFRPVQPSDARRLQRMFYALPPESVRLRYHGMIKSISNEMAQRMAAVDFSRDMAIVGLVGPQANPRIIAEGRYTYDPSNRMGEFDIVVVEDYRGLGIGTFLANYLNKTAYARGLAGVYAEVIQDNVATQALLQRAWPTAKRMWSSGSCRFQVAFPRQEILRPKDSILLYSGRIGDFRYGDEHPFDPTRARVLLQLMRRQGYLSEPWMRVEEPRMVGRERLVESHDPAFVDALERANDGVMLGEYEPFQLGTDDCPVFAGLFDYVLLTTSATITGVDLITNENANVVFNPVGGFHHAFRDHAEGFCYLNDAIVAIDLLLSRGHRVAYIDIDAHHGNGVQDAYYRDDRVLFVSLHESGRFLYPWIGFEDEIGEGMGRGFTVNVPLPVGTDDEAYQRVFHRVATPAVERFQPTVVVAVIGADTHRSDPLADLQLTNNGMVSVMERIRGYTNHLLLLGAGGYDQKAATRAWARMWAAANRIDDLPDFMSVGGGAFLGTDELAGVDIVDMSYRVVGEDKKRILAELDRVVRFHEETTFPLIEAHLSAAP